MNVAIYGTMNVSLVTKMVIEKYYNAFLTRANAEAFDVVAFVGEEAEAKETDTDAITITSKQFVKLYKKNMIAGLIIPIMDTFEQLSLVTDLIKMGVSINDIYYAERLEKCSGPKEEWLADFIIPYLEKKYLPYLEFHVADQCNLNCRACEHYSGLVAMECFPVYEKVEQDLKKLKEYIQDIGIIRILGGEPLLNKELEKYILLTREIFPLATIYVVTNGLAIKTQKETLFNAMRTANVGFNISWYPPLEHKKDEISAFLDEKQVSYGFSSLITTFTKKQTLEKKDKNIFYSCYQAHCNNLYDGKVAACFLPFTTKYFNEYFGKELPEDGAIDLYDNNLSTEKLKARLLIPFERCAYCTEPVEIPWGMIGNPSVLGDWVIEE